MIYLLFANLSIFWGYSIKVPSTSAFEPALLMPPPTTLLGALARGLSFILRAKKFSIGEIVTLRPLSRSKKPKLVSFSVTILDFIKYATACPIGDFCFNQTHDMVRTEAIPYLQSKYLTQPSTWFGVHAWGRTYVPNASLRICFCIDGEKAEEKLGKDWRDFLKGSIACIMAVGAKESMVCVDYDSILLARAEISDLRTVTTRYYLPLHCTRNFKPENCVIEEFWSHRGINSFSFGKVSGIVERIPYLLPIRSDTRRPVKIKVELSDHASILVPVTNNGRISEDIVVIDREWLK